MKQTFLFLSFFFLISMSHAQNLVPNPSFEQYSSCPDNQDQVNRAMGWSSFCQSPDYFNSCDLSNLFSVPINSFGNQNASDGNAYCGFYTYAGISNYREFIGSQLLLPLISGTKYYISFKVSRSDFSDCATNNLGVLFTTNSYSSSSPITISNHPHLNYNLVVSDSAIWQIINGTFIADSAYSYIVIGNFLADSLTDTIKFIGSACNAYYYIDNVCVSSDSFTCITNSNVNNNTISETIIHPNPADKFIYLNLFDRDILSGKIINLIGESVLSFSNNKKIDVSQIPDGVYLLQINYYNKISYNKIIIIH